MPSGHRVKLEQTPGPGTHVIAHAGDVIEFGLETSTSEVGSAWVRTNLGNGVTRLKEIVEHVEQDRPILARDWHDVPMQLVAGKLYSVTMPLAQVGRFEAKVFFLPETTDEPVWPEGENVVIKVEPAERHCANSIYTAFVRQFGPGKSRSVAALGRERLIEELESENYSVIPQSGTFRDVIRELDFIIDELRFRTLLLLPIHPIPTTYARMGRFGSPFAVMDFMDVDPALAEFDRRTTPMDQFVELVDAVHSRNAKLFIDIPLNHTGWASHLQITHPEWFARGDDRTFQSPGAWGVTWKDLAKLDYGDRGLWTYMADVFLFWCSRGVDGFRCDAGYMVALPVWEYIVAKVRLQYPDTIFLLEGLGGDPRVVEALLDRANLDWAYSELFQNVDRSQLESYLPGAIETSATKGILVHFAETHDNDRLASVSREYARTRTTLAALCSHNGGFGITNGVEWFEDEKIDVHNAGSLNWGSDDNLVDHIRRLNTILREHPAFHAGAKVHLIQSGHENAIAILRRSLTDDRSILITANLDGERSSRVAWNSSDFPDGEVDVCDLVSGRKIEIERQGDTAACSMAPGEVFCLTSTRSDLQDVESALRSGVDLPEHWREQRLRAKALEVYAFFHPGEGVSVYAIDEAVRDLGRDPGRYCARCARRSAAQAPALSPVVSWEWPRDIRRTVMLPPGHLLHVSAPASFVAELRCGETSLRREISLPRDDGTHFTLLLPVDPQPEEAIHASLIVAVHEPEGTRRAEGVVLLAPAWTRARVKMSVVRREAERRDSYALCTNGLGGMAQVRGLWGEVRSQYDCLLAGNLDPDYPVDRHVMLTRCRTWLVCRGYSQEIDRDCLERFAVGREGTVTWHFSVPACEGKVVRLDVHLRLHEGCNAASLSFCRQPSDTDSACLIDVIPAKIIVRPDIEDRTVHAKTKARSGPDSSWPAAVRAAKKGFCFAPVSERQLDVEATEGTFTSEPEWIYAVDHPLEAERGLGGSSDLFSPGYFTLELAGGQSATLNAQIRTDGTPKEMAFRAASSDACEAELELPVEEAMRDAMRHFIVKRNEHKTVIAGYPWFLDWGRDTLICLRGLIAAGMTDEARSILLQLAWFELHGTLPNVIHGRDASNRDTSDAPLWFFVACRELVNAERGAESGCDHRGDFLSTDCGGRTVRDVLYSIGESYINGTANGIGMDADSGLIFSPSHFSWMDTNHPAGTPRQGYPIEIQALWYAALSFLFDLDPRGEWRGRAEQVRESIRQRFRVQSTIGGRQSVFLSDCLHAVPGQPARDAVADDHVRPNQLLAITLGAVSDGALCASVVASCEELLVPGAIRSLADRPVEHRLAVEHQGRTLNDPSHPYWGTYRGDEDTRRKPAYHNGTAWTWLFPSYCEALYLTYGDEVRDTALALLGSCTEVINRGCLGQVPEIVDGDAPHMLRGCGAQAWGVAELCRVGHRLGRRAVDG